MKRLQQLAEAFLKPINPATVLFLGAYTVLWGWWVANPFWNVFDQADLYSKLAWVEDYGVNSELFWGSIAIFCGSVICHGALKRSYHSLTRGATIAFFHWLMIGTFYFWGDWQNTGGITSLSFAAYAAFVYLNVCVNNKDDKNPEHILSD